MRNNEITCEKRCFFYAYLNEMRKLDEKVYVNVPIDFVLHITYLEKKLNPQEKVTTFAILT